MRGSISREPALSACCVQVWAWTSGLPDMPLAWHQGHSQIWWEGRLLPHSQPSTFPFLALD